MVASTLAWLIPVIALGVGFWLGAILVVIAMCQAGARDDAERERLRREERNHPPPLDV